MRGPEYPRSYYGGLGESQVSQIAAPDNLAVDSLGQLWIIIDGAPPGAADERCRRGPAGRRFGAETTMFVAVQHPGGGRHRAGADQPVAEQPIGSGQEVVGGGHPAGLTWQGGLVPILVVAAALLDDAGRVLVAQRSRPVELAGRWEFPGGKVETGESEPDALVRECREELGVVARPLDFVAEAPIPAGRLRLWTASMVSGTPQPYEHSELRWVSAAELDALDWLEPDRPLLPPLRALLLAT